MRSGADTESRTRDLTLTKGALYQLSHISEKEPGGDLLSHNRTLHYHRRDCISLLCSEWIQVVLQHYGLRAYWV